VAGEAILTFGGADPGAKDESCALVDHAAGEAERCHRVLHWMLDKHPYLAHQLPMFYHTPTEGYPRGGEFVGRVSPRSGTRRYKEHKI
jgi:hypothetical protein